MRFECFKDVRHFFSQFLNLSIQIRSVSQWYGKMKVYRDESVNIYNNVAC